MSLKETVHEKILGILREQKKPGEWKVLIVDSFSKRIINTCCKIHELMTEGITLIEDINQRGEALPLLEAIYLITPTEKSIKAVIADFRNPKTPQYKAAHVFFTEACPDEYFSELSRSPSAKFFKTFQEINISFLPYESQVYSLDCPETFQSYYNPAKAGSNACLERCAEQIATLCGTLAEYPVIRFRSEFDRNAEFAKLVQQKLDARKADDKNMKESTVAEQLVLLILDRGFDPISPLVHELTFQAMAYDLLPIKNDVFKYDSTSGMAGKDYLLDESDELWVKLRHQHMAIVSQQLAKEFKMFTEAKQMAVTDKSSVRDLSQLIKMAPQFQKELNRYTAHFYLTEECMRHYQGYVDKLCKVEQDFATGLDSEGQKIKDHMKIMGPLLLDKNIKVNDKLRIILLHIINKGAISDENLDKMYQHAQIPPEQKCVAGNMQNLGIAVAQSESSGFMKLFSKKSQQPYMPSNRKPQASQHTFQMSRWVPYVKDIIEDTIDDKLDVKNFPFLLGAALRPQTTIGKSARQIPHIPAKGKQAQRVGSRLILFIMGGVTYSEMRCAYNSMVPGKNWEVLIGATHILTPEIFLSNLQYLSASEHALN